MAQGQAATCTELGTRGVAVFAPRHADPANIPTTPRPGGTAIISQAIVFTLNVERDFAHVA